MNLSYCRFRNTLNDLRDCSENMDYMASEDEEQARIQLIKLCQEIVDFYGHEVDEA